MCRSLRGSERTRVSLSDDRATQRDSGWVSWRKTNWEQLPPTEPGIRLRLRGSHQLGGWTVDWTHLIMGPFHLWAKQNSQYTCLSSVSLHYRDSGTGQSPKCLGRFAQAHRLILQFIRNVSSPHVDWFIHEAEKTSQVQIDLNAVGKNVIKSKCGGGWTLGAMHSGGGHAARKPPL